ncbi:thioredoxin domain-containing protein [Sulfurospirillum sp. hDNRA2]|uniref:thioredoxin domain-containing protein n=1 Tax=Sulfurospirillum sp. hDNRA2 TaxID=3237298 RepID=UPI0020B8BF96|nr:thioredoxin domain-containing protein [Sulfurospirillum sp. DNRA8]MCP3650958.1 thioredoxin domain-containing protein [Sulfurospirillum sp. DNRA8]MCR1809804.1 thioredoxin domain-containing protein [Sulfurospirillum sp. DNRA8]
MHTNELIHEDSPYLLQHAHNPVNWMAWSDKALAKAKEENKLIFLSIGYSTCHWCHVMERETFEDEVSAKLLNDSYVSIKVDREEMPDLDKYYQDVHYLLTKRAGGWPLSIIMTPQQQVIFAGTYLPPQSAQGRMGFRELTSFIKGKFDDAYEEVQKSAVSIEAAIKQYERSFEQKEHIDAGTVLETFVSKVKTSYDDVSKGIGSAPKFPHASTWNALLDIYAQTKNLEALYMSEDALFAMAQGGINDQIEGGFYRYSVDEAWVIPHFEKMLYTNAELIEVYAKVFKITQKPYFQEVIDTTIKAMDERFLKEGLYLSASDADSEGEEGKYFVFGFKQAQEALLNGGLSEVETKAVMDYFGITKFGNFEHQTTNPTLTCNDKPVRLDEAIVILKAERQKVAYPFIDTKILTAWNALMVTALFEADKIEKAKSVLDTLLNSLHVNGILYHQMVLGGSLKVEALLEDYAFLIEALLRAYAYSNEAHYLELAKRLSHEAEQKFYKEGTWYLSDKAFRAKAVLEDNSYKSPLSTMIKNLFELAKIEDDTVLFIRAKDMLESFGAGIQKYAHAYPEAVRAVALYI